MNVEIWKCGNGANAEGLYAEMADWAMLRFSGAQMPTSQNCDIDHRISHHHISHTFLVSAWQHSNQPYICLMLSNKYEEGQVLLVDKPLKWTSFDVVRKVRNLVKIKKVGHAGTLDPLATGLLILCTGKFTKRINEYMAQEKEYTGTITLGATTASFDLENEPANQRPTGDVTEAAVHTATRQFTGEIMQVPPMHSAIKKDGIRVYELARRGETIELAPRKILIREFVITRIEMPVLHFRVICSTGTYIRSLANDFGAALGCGGYLSSLCRTRIGAFTLAEAISMTALENELKAAPGFSQKG